MVSLVSSRYCYMNRYMGTLDSSGYSFYSSKSVLGAWLSTSALIV